jgi:hypothetical protein
MQAYLILTYYDAQYLPGIHLFVLSKNTLVLFIFIMHLVNSGAV